MPLTYEPIASIQYTSTAPAPQYENGNWSYLSFTNIPQTYTDLKIVANATAGATSTPFWRVNEGQANYSKLGVWANPSIPTVSYNDNYAGGYQELLAGYGLGTNGNAFTIDILNYTSSSSFRNGFITASRGPDTSNPVVQSLVFEYANGVTGVPEALTKFSLFIQTGAWANGTNVTLYGIKAA